MSGMLEKKSSSLTGNETQQALQGRRSSLRTVRLFLGYAENVFKFLLSEEKMSWREMQFEPK